MCNPPARGRAGNVIEAEVLYVVAVRLCVSYVEQNNDKCADEYDFEDLKKIKKIKIQVRTKEYSRKRGRRSCYRCRGGGCDCGSTTRCII